MRALRLLLVLVLVLALGAGAARAQGAANVQVGKVRIGYLNEHDPGWLPVSFPLENLGGESTVQLVAKVQAGKETLWTSEKTVALPPKSRRVETVYVRLAERERFTVDAQVVVDGRAIQSSTEGLTFRSAQARTQRSQTSVPLHALLVREGPNEHALISWLEPPPGSLTNPTSTAPAPAQWGS